MPWDVKKDDRCGKSKPWGVVKDDGTLVACHPTQKAAIAQQRALYASEEKAMDETVEKCGDGMEEFVPWEVTTFAALDTLRATNEHAEYISDLADDLQTLTRNILSNPDITDKPSAIKALADEFAALLAKPAPPEEKAVPPGLLSRVMHAIKAWGADPEPPAPQPTAPPFMLWKEAGGGYRWLATYSNKYRDRDRPPEILSEAAHEDFVKAVDGGEWAAPELWLWHVPGTQFGVTDWVAYADGFALASGTADKAIAEHLENYPAPLAVSHGMPVAEIVRDAGDPTVITRYRTREISVLPDWAAANALTAFDIQEVKEMAIPQDKKGFLLAAGLTEDHITAIEADLEGKAKEAADAGLEFKATETQPPVAQKDETTETVEVAPPAPAPVAALTAQDIATAVREVLLPLEERLTALESLKEQMAAFSKSEDARVAEQLAATPAASLADLLRGAGMTSRAVGNKDARIDGRGSLAKSGPAETEAPDGAPQYTGVPFINSILSAARQ